VGAIGSDEIAVASRYLYTRYTYTN